MSDPLQQFPSVVKLSRTGHPAALIPGPSFGSSRRSAGRSYAQDPMSHRAPATTVARPTVRRTRQAGQTAMANISSQFQRLHFTGPKKVQADKAITGLLLERDSVFGTANRYILPAAPETWSNRYCRPRQDEPHSPPGGPGFEMADTSVPDTYDTPSRASSVGESDKYVVVDPFLGHADLEECRDTYEWLRRLDDLESGPVGPSPPPPFEPLRPIAASPFTVDEFEPRASQQQPRSENESDGNWPLVDEPEMQAWRRQPLVGSMEVEREPDLTISVDGQEVLRVFFDAPAQQQAGQ
ncbi:MAG: hypothetical protein M1815_001856 [Lichina confinis]|nr:MAG: hypothetical protein M1815_001856 [Lichina confinis]